MMSDKRDKYREAARRMVKAAVPQSDVELHANVHEIWDTGAFVEAVIWVPASELQDKTDGDAKS